MSFALPVKLKHIMILTGEPSGDLHAGNLVKEIKLLNPNIYFSGIGGIDLKNQDVDLFYDIADLSVMGYTEVILQFRKIKQAFDFFKMKLITHKPDLIIMLDYPGFNLKAAQYAKENFNIKILYYITPKVWAWKKSRLKKIKRYVDHAALIFPFEKKIFKKANIISTYVGNPLLDDYPLSLTKPIKRVNRAKNIKKTKILIGLLPGSRKTEVSNLLSIMIKAGKIIQQKNDQVTFVISQASSIKTNFLQQILNQTELQIEYSIKKGPVKNILTSCDFLIAASGTVTLEAALCCVPTIIIYKVSAISYFIAKSFVKIKYAGLANLIVNKEVMPELIQNDATPKNISRIAIKMLDNLPVIENRLMEVRHLLGDCGAAKRTANIALNLVKITDNLY